MVAAAAVAVAGVCLQKERVLEKAAWEERRAHVAARVSRHVLVLVAGADSVVRLVARERASQVSWEGDVGVERESCPDAGAGGQCLAGGQR